MKVLRNTLLGSPLIILLLPFHELHVYVPEAFSMCNNIERLQPRRGSWNWLNSRCVEKIRKRNTFLRTPSIILLLPFHELYVHVPEAFSMCNNIERSQLRRGSCNWFNSRCVGCQGPTGALCSIFPSFLDFCIVFIVFCVILGEWC